MRRLPSLPNPADARAITAYRLRYIEGKQLREIAEQLNVHTASVPKLCSRGVKLCVGEEMRESAKTGALAELDALRTQAYEWMHGEYVFAQFGKIVTDAEGKPLKDIGPNLAAMDRILKVEKRRAEIFGYDAPKRSEVKVITEDAILAEIARLEAQMEQAEAEMQESADQP